MRLTSRSARSIALMLTSLAVGCDAASVSSRGALHANEDAQAGGDIPEADDGSADVTVLDGASPDATAPDGAAVDSSNATPREQGGADGGDASPIVGTYAIVVLPDTQYYASSWPEIFDAQTRWIVENRGAEAIGFVLHLGDIVDADVPAQWESAARSLQLLDGELPYVLTAGNHDYANLADRTGLFNSYFPPSRFAHNSWFAGTFEQGHGENSFSLIDVGTARWLVMALEFGPRDEVLSWATAVLSLFHATPAIIITHAYLEHGGVRYDHTRAGGSRFNPHDYVMMGQPGSTINDGEEMWSKLIEPNSNVKFVFSGHDVDPTGALPPGTTGRLTSVRADGTHVHQILANYQTCLSPPCKTNKAGVMVRGGNGFLRILRFAPADHTVSVTTYSPYIDQYLTDKSNQFTLPLD
jgi:hypothetical protein